MFINSEAIISYRGLLFYILSSKMFYYTFIRTLVPLPGYWEDCHPIYLVLPMFYYMFIRTQVPLPGYWEDCHPIYLVLPMFYYMFIRTQVPLLSIERIVIL